MQTRLRPILVVVASLAVFVAVSGSIATKQRSSNSRAQVKAKQSFIENFDLHDIASVKSPTLGGANVMVASGDTDGRIIVPLSLQRERGVSGVYANMLLPGATIKVTAFIRASDIYAKTACAPLPYHVTGAVRIAAEYGGQIVAATPLLHPVRWRRYAVTFRVPRVSKNVPGGGLSVAPDVVITVHRQILALQCPGKEAQTVMASGEVDPKSIEVSIVEPKSSNAARLSQR